MRANTVVQIPYSFMKSSVAIIVGIVLAIASALAICLGYSMQNQEAEITADSTVMTCGQILENPPMESRVCVTLTDFQRGKHFVEYDYDGDGQWETVFIPLFPGNLRRLGDSYHGVIVQLNNVKSETELREVIKSGEIPLEFQSWNQELNKSTYYRMAQKYPSMNFGKNVHLATEESSDFNVAGILIFGGGIGIVGAILLCGIGAFVAMLNFLKRRIAKDDARHSVEGTSNRAGLPEVNPTNPADGATPAATSSTQLQSEQLLQEANS